MTATLAEQQKAAELGTLRSIATMDLMTAEWNARKTFDSTALDELTASIREHGVQVPLLVRPDGSAADRQMYEVVAGHRRLAAAERLGLPDVPCIVREMDDAEAREIGLVDNLQREGVPALEEADAYAELQKTLGTPTAIALRVGKPVSYVTQRLQLVSLGTWPRKALAERLITIEHALLLARLGGEEQDANLKWALNPNEGPKKSVEEVIAYRVKDLASGDRNRYAWREPQSVLSLKDHIEQNVGRKLGRAPWDLDDASLTEAGTCTGCPSNTRDNTALFGDLAIDEATCENGACFEQKRATFVRIRLDAADPAGLTTVRISWKDSAASPRMMKDTGAVNLQQTFRHGQWVEAKKGSCEHVCAGVTVDWSDDARYGFGPSSAKLRKPGERILVCVTPKCKAHPKSWEKAEKNKADSGHRNENSAEARAAREKQAELNKAENAIRAEAVKAALAGVSRLGGDLLRAVVQQAIPGWSGNDLEHIFPGLEKAVAKEKVDSPAFARAAAAVLLLSDEVSYFAHDDGYSTADDGRAELVKLLRVMGYDASKHWAKPRAEKPAAKKAAAKPAKKAAKKGGRK